MSLHQRNIFISVVSIYIATFLMVLPLLCHKLGFSSYFQKPTEPYKYLEAENEKRVSKAKEFFQNLKFKVENVHAREIEFSTVLLTAYRGSDTHYSLQVAARLLPQVMSDQGKSILTVLNSDPRPGLDEDAVSWPEISDMKTARARISRPIWPRNIQRVCMTSIRQNEI